MPDHNSDSRDTPHSYARIAEDFETKYKESTYNVVIIGSGYGGAIAAARMAAAGFSVCLLERGAEWLPGDFPAAMDQMTPQLQVHTDGVQQTPIGKASALYDLRINETMCALVGCGLGGTSLINANVALEAKPAIFDLSWPKALQKPHALGPYYRRSVKALGATLYPGYQPQGEIDNTSDYPPLNKFEALKKSAAAIGATAKPTPINVNFNKNHSNWAGVYQPACNRCGDCCSGCNTGAKTTTAMNFLPFAKANNAKIFTLATVDYITRDGAKEGHWAVHVRETEGKARGCVIYAHRVILAAGALGSPAILLRSQQKGLQLSKRLGKNFSGNGDMIALGYNSYWQKNNGATHGARDKTDQDYLNINAIGMGETPMPSAHRPGPCITGVIDLRIAAKEEHAMIIEEGVIPGMLASVLPMGIFMAASQSSEFIRYGQQQAAMRLNDISYLGNGLNDPAISNRSLCYRGPIARTQCFLVMGHDSAQGELSLSGNGTHVVINWDGVGKSRAVSHQRHILARLNDASQGQLLENPLSHDAFGNKLMTVHPLGGCPMGDSVATGVVNDKCQVFDEQGDIHEGLLVCDGSVMPRSLGANPLLTICAITERAMDFVLGVGMSPEHYYPYPETNAPSRRSSDKPPSKSPDAQKPTPGELDPPIARWWDDVREAASLLLIHCLAKSATAARRQSGELDENEHERDLWLALQFAEEKFFTHLGSRYSPGFRFTETMRGKLALNRGTQHLTNAQYRQAVGLCDTGMNDATLELTITAASLFELIQNRSQAASISEGQLTLRALSKAPIKIRQSDRSQVLLLVQDRNAVSVWKMIYTLNFKVDHGQNGYRYQLIGEKSLRKTESSHWWKDLTQLDMTLYQLNDTNDEPELVGSGYASLSLQDTLHNFSSIETPLCHSGLLPKGTLSNDIEKSIGDIYLNRLAATYMSTIFACYGGLPNYLMNATQKPKENADNPREMLITPSVYDGVTIKNTLKLTRTSKITLTRYNGGGTPVILAPGMGVNASSFATTSVNTNIVESLTHIQQGELLTGYDVWLLDYRASYDSGHSESEFSIDDIAREDWPDAIDFVKKITAERPQIIAHCVGSLSLLMGLLVGKVHKDTIQSIICSQLTLHPVTNWLNNAKADAGIVDHLADLELIKARNNCVDMNSFNTLNDKAMDIAAYQSPVPTGENCQSPTCKRIFAIYGPSYLHDNLNSATHDRLGDWFKSIHLAPFRHLSLIIARGFAVDKDGHTPYIDPHRAQSDLTYPELNLPIHFVAGSLNLEFLPETSKRTFEWLKAYNRGAKHQYGRTVFKNYGHMDFFIGKQAHKDIFPTLVNILKDQAQRSTKDVTST